MRQAPRNPRHAVRIPMTDKSERVTVKADERDAFLLASKKKAGVARDTNSPNHRTQSC